jgi:hypothetical protein
VKLQITVHAYKEEVREHIPERTSRERWIWSLRPFPRAAAGMDA